MKNTFPYLYIVILLFVGASCTKSSYTSSKSVNYAEDLTRVRPKYTYSEEELIKPVKIPVDNSNKVRETAAKSSDINRKLQPILTSMYEQNKAIKFVSGFRIQIYVGNVRAESDAAKAYVYRNFQDMNPYVSFSQPTYRVKVGDFMTRADAERYLDVIKMQYPSALIQPDKVEIKKGLQLQLSSN